MNRHPFGLFGPPTIEKNSLLDLLANLPPPEPMPAVERLARTLSDSLPPIRGPLVRNAVGTTNHLSPHGCWKETHRRSLGQEQWMCSTAGCYQTAEVGAHVEVLSHVFQPVAIAMLCHECNCRKDDFYLEQHTHLVLI
jgi:hypothetical protein